MSRPNYPINYERTLAAARKQTELSRAVEHLDEIEERWSRVSNCEDYSYYDIRKDILLSDIRTLIGCSVMMLNKISELEDLLSRRKPNKGRREPKVINLPKEK